MADLACWFCGRPAGPQERYGYQVGLHRDAKTTFLVVAVHEKWATTGVEVPRCRRCCLAHYIEGLLCLIWLVLLALAVVTFFESVAAQTLSHLGRPTLHMAAWLVPFTAWLALRNAWWGLGRWFPHNRRYAREHPAVQDLLTDGWHHGRAPFGNLERWFNM